MIDLLYILSVVKKKWWIFIIVPVVCVALTFYIRTNSTKLYKSYSQLSTGFTTGEDVKLVNESFNARDAGLKFSNLIEDIKSPLILGITSYRVLLHDLESESPFSDLKSYDVDTDKFTVQYLNKIKEVLKDKIENSEILSAYDPIENDAKYLLIRFGYDQVKLNKSLLVRRLGITDYIYIEFISKNPEFSAYIINTLCEQITRYTNSLNTSRSSGSVEFFQELVNSKKQILEAKSNDLKNFKERNNFLNYDVESEAKVNQITEYEKSLSDSRNKLQALLLKKNKLQAQLEGKEEKSNITSSNKINADILELRKKINDLNEVYIRQGSNNATLADSLRDLRTQYNIAISQQNNSRNGDYGASKESIREELSDLDLEISITENNISSYSSKINELKSNASNFSNKESEISRLTREVEIAENEYIDAQAKFNSANSKMASDLYDNSIKQVIKAQPAGKPESSKRVLFSILAGAVSFAFTFVIIIGIEFMDLRIKTPSKLNNWLGSSIPLIGSINLLKSKNVDFGKLFLTDKNKEINAFRHFIRKIRVELLNTDAKTVLFTSTQRKTGKTFFIISLAYAFSLVRKRVIIIDTNFRNNELSKLLSSKNTTKFIEKLSEGYLLEEAKVDPEPKIHETYNRQDSNVPKDVISPTFISGVDLISNTGSSATPAEILTGKDFDSLIDWLKLEYDYVFLEGSALNDYSDSNELVDFVDKIVCVFSAENQLKSVDRKSMDYLNSLNGKMMGCILNKVEDDNLPF